MTVGGLSPFYQGRLLLPVLGKVTSTRYTDRVQVRLVSGQSAADFADHADNLAHGFGAMLCRVRTARSGGWCWSSSAATPWPSGRPGAACPPASGSAGAAGRQAGGRAALAGPAAWHASADRGRDRRGESLAAVVAGPGDAARYATRAWPGSWPPIPS